MPSSSLLPPVPWRSFRRRRHTKTAAATISKTKIAAPTAMPAIAPVERPVSFVVADSEEAGELES